MKPYSNPLNKQQLDTTNAKERKPNSRKENYCKASYHLHYNVDSIFVLTTAQKKK